MQSRDKLFVTLIILSAFGGLIYLIKSVLAPFICSLVIAYFLDPLVDYMVRKYKLSRLASTSIILGLFFAVFTSVSSILLPIIYMQSVDLIGALPKYLNTITSDFYPQIVVFLEGFGFRLDSDFSHLIAANAGHANLADISKNFFGGAIDSSITLINVLSLIFITPILVFYLLKDWDILVRKTYGLLPRSISGQVREVAAEVDRTLAGYVRGQFNVCLILALFYSISLSLAGLNFGFLIGFLTGMFAFIPYIGMLCGTTVAIVVALFQWGLDLVNLSIISAVFLLAQIVESNFLTPKLIGDKIGLHPVWMIFGLFVFGVIFGFVGILLAVPMTAICGVVIKYFALKYKQRFGL